MTIALLERVAVSSSLREFARVAEALGLYSPGGRFMHLELDITNKCNIRCVMCFHSLESTRRERTVNLTPAEFAPVAAAILPHAHRLSLSLGNEPMMSPHFIEILRMAAPYRVPNVNFFTNALLLTDERIDAIINYGVTQVCVSTEGATKATYNAIRRDGDFDRLVRNVTRLVERRNAAGSATPRVRFDIVMMQRNAHELDAIVRLGASLGVQELSFRHMVPFDGLDMDGESLTRVPAFSNDCLERALAEAARLGLEVQSRPAFFPLPDPDAPPAEPAAAVNERPFIPTPYCPYPFFHVTMGPGGHVLPCPHAHGESPYGQVTAETPIEAIWLGQKFTTLRERILAHDPPDMCRRCPYLGDRYPDVTGLFASRTA